MGHLPISPYKDYTCNFYHLKTCHSFSVIFYQSYRHKFLSSEYDDDDDDDDDDNEELLFAK